MQEIPPLSPFSINKYLSMSDIFSNSIPVIFNVASQLNPGGTKIMTRIDSVKLHTRVNKLFENIS